MIDKINELLRRVEEFKPKAAAELEEFRIKVLGKKGELNALMEEFKSVAPEMKRELGQQLNRLKTEATERINTLREQLQNAAEDNRTAEEDLTRPGSAEHLGSRHPIALVKNQIVEIFSRLGYTVADGPEIEDDWHVFSALNFPPEHPARDMQDTFFIEKDPDILLRTHTSSIQVRTMERQKPPIRVICPGRVFRNEAMMEEIDKLLHDRDGLVLGICNGFQTLIKLGLLTGGKIEPQKADSPTLTTNNIGRHISRMAYLKVVSNLSPWLRKAELGGVYCNPMSHGEGRFVANEEWLAKLRANGQIAIQYSDPNGNLSVSEEWNPNGSYQCIEGITSPDGRILGKMGHNERCWSDTGMNIYGNQDMQLFASGVEYFK